MAWCQRRVREEEARIRGVVAVAGGGGGEGEGDIDSDRNSVYGGGGILDCDRLFF